MKQLIGQQIGQYQVEALLGEGGMGAVYRAHDLKHDRMVALKIMLANLAHKPQFRSRFMQEAEAIAHFSSPAIVTVYDTGTYEESPYIVMEYIEGGSLINYMRQLDWSGAKPTVETIIHIAAQVAEGLSYAHQRGLIHRDIKPGNVLLKMREGAYIPRQAIITDFGLAIQHKDGDEMDTAPFMGSLAYMSPEQCENKSLDGRSDIYALGILLYQLTTGQLPFKINAPADIVKHLDETPLPPSLINPDIPEILETITLKAMEKKPGDRYQSAAEMSHALRQALANPELQTAVIAQEGSGAVTQWLDNKWVAAIDVEDRVDIHQTWTSLGKNRLFIVHQYEESKVVGLEKDEITIGREDNNDIVLADQSVSGKHIQLVRTPHGWNVKDVGSTNHTYLGERLLDYEQAYDWPSNEPLRVGPYFLRWQPFEADHREHDGAPILAAAALAGATVAGAALLNPDDNPIRDTQTPPIENIGLIPEYSDGEILGIAIMPPTIELDPEMQNILEISITNRDVTVKDVSLRLEVEGRQPGWVTLSDYQMKLLPDETASTTALIDLSQASDILAGDHIIKLIATTDKGEMEFNDVRIIVNSQEEFGLDIHPSNLQEKVTCRLTISDQSNFQNEYTIMGIDDSDALMFEFDEPQNAILTNFDEQQQQIKVSPRQEAWLGFRIRPRKRPLFGSTKTMPFKIRVRTPETDWQSLNGQVEILPRITRRILLLLLLLLLIVGGIGAFSFYSIQGVKANYENQLKDSQSDVEKAEAELEAAIASGASEEEIAEKEANLEQAQETFDTISEEAAAAGVDLTEEDLEAIAAAAEAEAAAEEEAAAAATAAAEEALAELEASFTPTPEPNNPPTDIEFSATTVTENIDIGTVIGSFSAVDPDVASAGENIVAFNRTHLSRVARQSNDFTFSLISGSGSTHNDYFALNGSDLVSAVDIDFEDVESLSFRVQVADAAGDTFEKSFTLTVIDTDDIPQLSISDISVSEADGSAEITVSVGSDNFDTATVDYATSDGTAVAGTDYTTTSGTLSWDKGDTDSQTITVPLVDNEIDQVDRTFVVTLTNADKAIISSGSATVTITDDDVEPTLSISDLTVSESVSGGKASITVELTGASSEIVSVDYATSDTTTTAGDDYVATNGTLTWAAEATGSTTFDVTINTDDVDEADETFLVTLSGAQNATISDSDATITITDDNDSPKITIGDVSLTEGDTQITVPVTMTGKTSEEAWVEYSTSNGSGSTAATADFPDPDFDTASGRLTWDAGTEGEQTITIQVNDDDIDEVDQEFFVVSLYDNSTTVTLQDTAGNVYINDDDEEPTISLENLSSSPVSESASTVEAVVTVDGRSSREITLYYSTQNDTATAGEDYTAVTNGSITWDALETSAQSIRLTILDDETDEDAEETFTLQLNSADNAQLHSSDNSTSIIIQDDDPEPEITATVSNSGVDEDVASGKVTISVSLDRASTQPITVTYTTVDGTAVAGDDYTAKTNDLTWNPGEEDPIEVTIDIIDDEIFEADEEFIFRLENVSSSATIGTVDTTVEIRNDDPAPIITIDSVSPALDSIFEDTSLITVTLISDRQSSSEFTVGWETSLNSGVGTDYQAVANSDYASDSDTLTWPADSAAGTTQSFTIELLEDTIDELDESFLVNLTSTDADIDDSADSTTISIQDNDTAPEISVSDLSQLEADIASFSVPVTMAGGSYQVITVPYTITNGTATSGDDYTATATGTLTWTANITDTSQTISLSIIEDFYDEEDETILITLGTVSPTDAATITTADATITITDDDVAGVPVTTPAPATIDEDPAGTNTATFDVSLDTEPTSDVVMSFTPSSSLCSVSPTTATYTDRNAQTFTITATDDAVDNDAPTCTIATAITSGDPSYFGSIDPDDVTVAINDDDDPPTLEIGSANITEGDASTITIPVTMSGLSGSDITVTYTPVDNSATATSDYVLVASTLTWSAGTDGVQNITITTPDDLIYEGTEDFYVDISTTDSATITTPRGTITINDNETAPQLTIAGTTVTEGDDGTTTNATVTVSLSGVASEDDITVQYFTGDDTATAADNDYDAIAESAATILTWTYPDTADKTFDVTINGDFVDEGSSEQLTVNLSNASANAAISTSSAIVTITDDDTAGFALDTTTLTVVDSAGSESGSFLVTLDTEPANDVNLTFVSTGECTVTDPTALNSTNYTTGVAVTVSGAVDGVVDGDATCQISASSITGDSVYAALPTTAVGTVDVTVTDDDVASFILTPTTLTVDDSTGSNSDSFIVTLGSQPASDVNLTFVSTGECTVSTPSALNSTNYNTGVAVTVTGVVDNVEDGDASCAVTANSVTGDAVYVALGTGAVGTVNVTVTDDDAAGFSLSPTTLSVDDSTGSNTADFIVTLNSEPASAVNLTFVSDNPTECTVSTPSAINSGNYDTGVTVTVTGAVDDVADGDATCQISADTITGDTTYVNLGTAAVGTVDVTVTDDDAAGFTLSTNTLTLDDSTGSNTDSFIVTLDSEPASDVNLTFVSNNVAECSVSTPLALNSSNYDTGVTVTVTGAVDDVVDGDAACTISASNIAGDATYVALGTAAVGTVNTTVNNDDVAGVSLSATTLALNESAPGNSDTFVITLDSEPSAPTSGVRITLGTTNSECTAVALANTPTSRADFDTTNWQTGITVTVTAADDTIVEGAHSCEVTMTVVNAQTSAEYDDYVIGNVTANITDDD